MPQPRRGGRHARNRMNPDTRITVAELAERQYDEWFQLSAGGLVVDFIGGEHEAWSPRAGVEFDGQVHIMDGDRPIDPGVFTADMTRTLSEWSDSFVGQPYRAPDGRMFSLDDGHPPGFMGTDPYQRVRDPERRRRIDAVLGDVLADADPPLAVTIDRRGP